MLHFLESSARISNCETYRYELLRVWDRSKALCMFLMLNPSKANATILDPTIRRCIGFADLWGYGGLIVGNIFALRSTDPQALYCHADPVGPDNDRAILALARSAAFRVAAWGNHGAYRSRGSAVVRMLQQADLLLHCLGDTLAGQPNHPLYLKKTTQPILYPVAKGTSRSGGDEPFDKVFEIDGQKNPYRPEVYSGGVYPHPRTHFPNTEAADEGTGY